MASSPADPNDRGVTEPGMPTAAQPAGQTVGSTGPAAREGLVELHALLGRGTSYVGKLHFEGHVRIEGRFQGPIRGDGVLVIADEAEVESSIEVGSCIVMSGKVVGDIRARDAIELHASAVVTGDLHAPAIFIDRGAKFQGRCQMAPLEVVELES